MELHLLVQEGERGEADALIEIGHQARGSYAMADSRRPYAFETLRTPVSAKHRGVTDFPHDVGRHERPPESPILAIAELSAHERACHMLGECN